MPGVRLTSYEIEEVETRAETLRVEALGTSRFVFMTELPITGQIVRSRPFPLGLWTESYRDIVSEFRADLIEASHEEANAENYLRSNCTVCDKPRLTHLPSDD